MRNYNAHVLLAAAGVGAGLLREKITAGWYWFSVREKTVGWLEKQPAEQSEL